MKGPNEVGGVYKKVKLNPGPPFYRDPFLWELIGGVAALLGLFVLMAGLAIFL